MDLQLGDKRALVTGGSRGLGKAIALELAREGAAVVIAARSAAALRESALDIERQTGATVATVVLDVMDPESIAACVAEAVDRLGGLDILVNAAARTGGHGEEADVYASASEEGMLADFQEKVVGSLRLARAAEPHLHAAGGGRIILFSGGAGRFRGGLVSAGARNRAINNLTLTLANALGSSGIGVVCIAPGNAVTERQMDAHRVAAEEAGLPVEDHLRERAARTTLLGRLTLAGDVAKVGAFLSSPLSWPINAAVVEVSGGSSPDVHYDLDPHPPWKPGTAV
ncbi:MAG TPA: SDR family oxidoreductase [Baekduia sp.]|nr:SDR family oxidoreductase [Baekduia sp.]